MASVAKQLDVQIQVERCLAVEHDLGARTVARSVLAGYGIHQKLREADLVCDLADWPALAASMADTAASDPEVRILALTGTDCSRISRAHPQQFAAAAAGARQARGLHETPSSQFWTALEGIACIGRRVGWRAVLTVAEMVEPVSPDDSRELTACIGPPSRMDAAEYGTPKNARRVRDYRAQPTPALDDPLLQLPHNATPASTWPKAIVWPAYSDVDAVPTTVTAHWPATVAKAAELGRTAHTHLPRPQAWDALQAKAKEAEVDIRPSEAMKLRAYTCQVNGQTRYVPVSVAAAWMGLSCERLQKAPNLSDGHQCAHSTACGVQSYCEQCQLWLTVLGRAWHLRSGTTAVHAAIMERERPPRSEEDRLVYEHCAACTELPTHVCRANCPETRKEFTPPASDGAGAAAQGASTAAATAKEARPSGSDMARATAMVQVH